MDEILVSAIEGDGTLAAFFAERTEDSPWFYSSSSVGIGPNPEIPQFPFMIYNELPSSPYQEVRKISNASQRVYPIYVYDAVGDYGRINAILNEIRRIVKAIGPFEIKPNASYPRGLRCSDSSWDGISGRLVDEGYHSIVRFGTARFVVSE